MRRALRVLLAGAVGVALVPGQAVATEGNLYPYGASIWAVSAQFTATVLPGPVWQVQAPALSPATAGNHWEMNWGCPVGGSEIAAVQWGGLRTQAASSLAFQVTADRRVIWSEGDAAAPQSPQGGRPYDVRLPGGNCNVHLALTQVEGRNQHARGYFIDSPRILVRDVSAPDVSLGALPGGWLPPSGTIQVSWDSGDNFGADGIGLQHVLVDGQTRWTGGAGAGRHTVDLPLSTLGDGVHTVQVRVDGDGTDGASAAGTISVDGTPPTTSDLAAAATGEPGAVNLTWTAADNLSGVADSRVEIDDSTDVGSAWTPVASAGGAGRKSALLRALPVADGLHAWRLRTTDVAGNVGFAQAPGRVAVDTTPPRIDVHSVPTGWVSRADIDMTATDNLQAALGLGATEIDVNAAGDGSDAGEWLRRSSASAPAGRRIVPLDLTGLESGRHAVRIIVRNGGPFSSSLVAEKRAAIRVDLNDPEISRVAFSGGGTRPTTVSWVADDAHSGVATATVQWRDGAAWRTLGREKAADGGGSVVVNTSALPEGERTMRLLLSDAAGNVTARTGTAMISGTGAGGTAGGPVARLRGARVTVTLARSRTVRRGSRTVLVRRVAIGTRIRITGRLRDRAGRGIVGAQIQIRDNRGRVIGRGLTKARGRFAVDARPVGGGIVRVGVARGRLLLPRRAAVDLRLEVRPSVAVAASSTTVAVGGQVLFSGRLRPSPADLGLGSRKGIVLQWLDPVRRIWRPVVNARIRRDGTFAIPWTFGLGGLTIPMRVVVPKEVGWPLLPARSKVIRVRVG